MVEQEQQAPLASMAGGTLIQLVEYCAPARREMSESKLMIECENEAK